MVAALNLFALQIGRARDMPRDATGRAMVKALRNLPTQVQSIIDDESHIPMQLKS